MPMIDGLSLEAPMSEERWMETEIGLRWRQVSPAEMRQALSSGLPQAMIISDPDLYIDHLRSAANHSVVVVQISDEGYSPERRALAHSPAIRHLFRHYDPRAASARQIVRAVRGFARDTRRSTVSARSVPHLYRMGAQVRARMNAWSSTPYTSFPLGYTNAFAAAFERQESGTRDRSISVVFRGNRGVATRIAGTDAARRMGDSCINFVEDHPWSGAENQGDVYVEELLHSRFALVPPGFVNGETFRYYEAVQCGALPIEVEVALTHQGAVPFRSPATIRARSWREALSIAAHMPEDERVSRVAVAQASVKECFARARTQLLQSMEG